MKVFRINAVHPAFGKDECFAFARDFLARQIKFERNKTRRVFHDQKDLPWRVKSVVNTTMHAVWMSLFHFDVKQ